MSASNQKFIIDKLSKSGEIKLDSQIELKQSIDRITSKLLKTFDAFWYNGSNKILTEINSENVIFKIRTYFPFSPEYCHNKVERILNGLKEEGFIRDDFTYNKEISHIIMKETCDLENQLILSIPLLAFSADPTSKPTKIALTSVKEDKSFLPKSPYLIRSNMPANRELLLWANPLYGNKKIQRPATNSCQHVALNYIRERYKDSNNPEFKENRRIEKLYSQFRYEYRKNLTIHLQIRAVLESLLELYEKSKTPLVDSQEILAILDLIIQRDSFPFYQEAKELFNQFRQSLEKEILTIRVAELFENLVKFFISIDNKQKKAFLTQMLGCNYDQLVNNFLKERGYNCKAIKVKNSDALINFIFFEQECKAFNIYFSSWTPKDTLSTLLDDIEKNGPQIVQLSGFVSKQSQKTFVKSYESVEIFEVNNFAKIPHFCHVVILVGGEIEQNGSLSIYFMDPNNEYSYPKKRIIYKMPYTEFLSMIVPFENNISLQPSIDNGDKVDACLVRSFSAFGVHGLELTRDPVISKEDRPSKIKFTF